VTRAKETAKKLESPKAKKQAKPLFSSSTDSDTDLFRATKPKSMAEATNKVETKKNKTAALFETDSSDDLFKPTVVSKANDRDG